MGTLLTQWSLIPSGDGLAIYARRTDGRGIRTSNVQVAAKSKGDEIVVQAVSGSIYSLREMDKGSEWLEIARVCRAEAFSVFLKAGLFT